MAEGKFIARQKFVLNCGEFATPGPRIYFLGETFVRWCLNEIEEPPSAREIEIARLDAFARSHGLAPIYTERQRNLVSLHHIYNLLCNQPNGELGFLPTNGDKKRFEIYDSKGQYRHITLRWSDGLGWAIDASSPLMGSVMF